MSKISDLFARWPRERTEGELVVLGSLPLIADPSARDLRDAFFGEVAAQIRNLDWERLVWIDSEGTAFLLDGERDRVDTFAHEWRLRSSWSLHNHPSGRSFSLWDFSSALHWDAPLLQIVKPSGSGEAFVRPTEGWPTNLDAQLKRSARTSSEQLRRRSLTEDEITRRIDARARKKLGAYTVSVEWPYGREPLDPLDS